jgi:hypothetical protein
MAAATFYEWISFRVMRSFCQAHVISCGRLAGEKGMKS